MSADPLQALVDDILASAKYRNLNLPPQTVRDLLAQEMPRHRSQKEALKSVRQKLHNIVAPYLGDPDYAAAEQDLAAAFADGAEAVQAFCRQMLNIHASTRERLPHFEAFYPALWARCGVPSSVLDLACAMHPFGLPWMDLPADVHYHAYDLHTPRLALINQLFCSLGVPALAEWRDILVSPPEQTADVGLFFKEAHRFEQRQRGCNRSFWQALKVNYLLVSLPASSLTGRRDLAEAQRRLVYTTLDGLPWPVEELEIGGELVFIIHKSEGPAHGA